MRFMKPGKIYKTVKSVTIERWSEGQPKFGRQPSPNADSAGTANTL